MASVEIKESGINKINEMAQAYAAKRGITVSNKDVMASITLAFMKSAVDYLNQHKEVDSEVEINILQLFDIGINYEEDADGNGEFIPYLNPGQEMKLRCKDDNDSEE